MVVFLTERQELTLKGLTKKIFTDERRDKGNALRAATPLVEEGHFTLEDFELLADIMEHWYKMGPTSTWGDLLTYPVDTTPTDGVTSNMQKFAIESKLQGRVPKVPSMDVVHGLLCMDIKSAGVGGIWGSRSGPTTGAFSSRSANKMVMASVEDAARSISQACTPSRVLTADRRAQLFFLLFLTRYISLFLTRRCPRSFSSSPAMPSGVYDRGPPKSKSSQPSKHPAAVLPPSFEIGDIVNVLWHRKKKKKRKEYKAWIESLNAVTGKYSVRFYSGNTSSGAVVSPEDMTVVAQDQEDTGRAGAGKSGAGGGRRDCDACGRLRAGGDLKSVPALRHEGCERLWCEVEGGCSRRVAFEGAGLCLQHGKKERREESEQGGDGGERVELRVDGEGEVVEVVEEAEVPPSKRARGNAARPPPPQPAAAAAAAAPARQRQQLAALAADPAPAFPLEMVQEALRVQAAIMEVQKQMFGV